MYFSFLTLNNGNNNNNNSHNKFKFLIIIDIKHLQFENIENFKFLSSKVINR